LHYLIALCGVSSLYALDILGLRGAGVLDALNDHPIWAVDIPDCDLPQPVRTLTFADQKAAMRALAPFRFASNPAFYQGRQVLLSEDGEVVFLRVVMPSLTDAA
jgi:hypothetical protein